MSASVAAADPVAAKAGRPPKMRLHHIKKPVRIETYGLFGRSV